MRRAVETTTDWQADVSGEGRFRILFDSPWFAVLLLMSLAAAVRMVDIDRLPSTDELYTVLAARGWAETGAAAIGEGVYGRAQLFTVAIGYLFRLFHDSIVVARLPSVVAGSLLVAGVFVWTRSVAGSLAAWIAAGLLCFSPLHILISQFARFYALLGLTIWLGSIGIYTLVERRPPAGTAMLLALGSALCLLLALHLQILTAFVIAGLSLWLVLRRRPAVVARVSRAAGAHAHGLDAGGSVGRHRSDAGRANRTRRAIVVSLSFESALEPPTPR